MSATAKKLAGWMRQQTESGKVARFDLRYRDTARGTDVHEVTPPEGHGAEWYGEAATELVDAAESDARALATGPQRYIVASVRPDERTEKRYALTVAAPGIALVSSTASDPAISDKVTVGLMRLLEAKEKIFMDHLVEVVESTRKMSAQVADENERLRQERLESFALIEEMLSQRADRELAQKQAEARAETFNGLAGDVRQLLLPAIANRLSGGSAVAATDPKVVLAKGILASLSDEQRSKVLELVPALGLTPQQQLAFGELLQSLN